ncbi:AraC family transcriptional regulator [Alkalibacter saccharofermentans]|uniref:Transcriptional regulator, AraC family n=1 Tax=Alkalibacter saccharofermentans DSM 14828 TaxID=1120975 RepID=A0A1M4W364_9FIRM|nr:AraC family transcriptional regulator [Alkalibacter saccharofermentans]SHE75711.1 transcriptional regulator, AraC family [Alkalibacter saccharofermentans DSM 14828]
MRKNSMRTHMKRQEMLGNDFEIYHYLDKTIRSVTLHHHDFYEIYYLISGEVEYYIEGKIHQLSPGDIVLINTTELHQARINEKESGYERLVLWINKNYLQELSSRETALTDIFEDDKRKSVVSLGFHDEKAVTGIFQKLIDLGKYNRLGLDLLKKAYVTELMINIMNIVFVEDLKSSTEAQKSALIDEMISFINENLTDELTMDMLAEKFFLSKYHLSREFKKYTNVSVYQYIKKKRLIKAKEYILNSEPVSEIYLKCGFGDYSNFLKAFKNEYGMTPKQFKDNMYNNKNDSP